MYIYSIVYIFAELVILVPIAVSIFADYDVFTKGSFDVYCHIWMERL